MVTLLAIVQQPITNFGSILTQQHQSRAHASKILETILQILRHAKLLHLTHLVEPMKAANTSIRFVSNLQLGSRSSIFLQVPQNGTARQTNWQEPNQLAPKEVI